MDGLELERARHLAALDALERINRVSRTASRPWAEILECTVGEAATVRVLDIACGGGDVLHELARRSARRGLDVELHGCDLSPVALARAEERAPRGVPVRWHLLDVLEDRLPGSFHIVTSSLFLHHLERDSAVALLRAMASVTERVLLVQDLRRSRLGYVLAWLGLMALTRSDVARRDGLVSVRAAFTLPEARALTREAGLRNALVRPCWPQRFALRWARR